MHGKAIATQRKHAHAYANTGAEQRGNIDGNTTLHSRWPRKTCKKPGKHAKMSPNIDAKKTFFFFFFHYFILSFSIAILPDILPVLMKKRKDARKTNECVNTQSARSATYKTPTRRNATKHAKMPACGKHAKTRSVFAQRATRAFWSRSTDATLPCDIAHACKRCAQNGNWRACCMQHARQNDVKMCVKEATAKRRGKHAAPILFIWCSRVHQRKTWRARATRVNTRAECARNTRASVFVNGATRKWRNKTLCTM